MGPWNKKILMNTAGPADIGNIYKKSRGKTKQEKDQDLNRKMTQEEKTKQDRLDELFFKEEGSVIGHNSYSRKKSVGAYRRTTSSPKTRKATVFGEDVKKAYVPEEVVQSRITVNDRLTSLDIETKLGGSLHAYQVFLVLNNESLERYVRNGAFTEFDIASNLHINKTLHGYELNEPTKDMLEYKREARFAAGFLTLTDYGKSHMSQIRNAIEKENKKRIAQEKT